MGPHLSALICGPCRMGNEDRRPTAGESRPALIGQGPGPPALPRTLPSAAEAKAKRRATPGLDRQPQTSRGSSESAGTNAGGAWSRGSGLQHTIHL